MARSFLNLPEVPIRFMRPKSASFSRVTSAVTGGQNGVGQSINVEATGGGTLRLTYEEMVLEGDETERHEVLGWLSARGNGSTRFFTVPSLIYDKTLFPLINGANRPFVYSSHSDGSSFSDGSLYRQATVWGEITANAAVGAGILNMRVYNAARKLRWSDWFSIRHDTKFGWRAYQYWDILTVSSEYVTTYSGATVTYRDYQLAIGPALREAVTAGKRVEFAEPKCAMSLAQDLSHGWSGWYSARPTVEFMEAY